MAVGSAVAPTVAVAAAGCAGLGGGGNSGSGRAGGGGTAAHRFGLDAKGWTIRQRLRHHPQRLPGHAHHHEAVGLGVVFVQHDGVILILEDAGSLHRWDISKTNQSKVAKNGKVDKAEGQEDPRLIPSSSLLLDLKW